MTHRVLIITDKESDAAALVGALSDPTGDPLAIERVSRVSEAEAWLAAGDIDVMLAALSLPDSRGVATFERLRAAAPDTPILILCGEEGDPAVPEAMRRGGQGPLPQGHFGSSLVLHAVRTLIERKAVEASLFVEKARTLVALNSISDAVIGTDPEGNVDCMNTAAEQMTRWPREEAYGRPIGEVMRVVDSATHEPAPNPVELALEQDRPKELAAGSLLIRRDGSEAAIEDASVPIHDAHGRIAGAMVVFHDVTAERALTAKMAHLAQHDFLTDLPNRVLLNDRIAQAIALAKRHDSHLALLFLDLDNFKHINDSLGHGIGDRLLQSVARVLSGTVRLSDTVCRLGGDEFVVLVTEDQHAEDAAVAAEKILTALAAPHHIDKLELHVTASIGISVYPADGRDAETLIKNADSAMYHAKAKGRNTYQFFKKEMNVRAVERQDIEMHLRRALDRSELVLHYQPQVDLNSGAITGVEALLRWMHPQWGMVLPTRFVDVAEDSGLIVPIGYWVMREACAQGRRWQQAGLPSASISVNVSALEFRREGFVERVRSVLTETGFAPELLQLEITESVLMRNAASSSAILHELKAMGVQLAVDDFGTGYSSLSYLHQFPTDVLKIDGSFVQDIHSPQDDGGIVRAIIAMGSSLKQRVIAEGVEEQVQLDFLKAQHCEVGQGFLFSRPRAADDIAGLLENGLPNTALPALVKPWV